jgi:small conductance mechanosensitive channel
MMRLLDRRVRSRSSAVIFAILFTVPGAGGLKGQDAQEAQATLEEANALVAELAELDGSLALLRELADAGLPEDQARVARRTATYSAQRRAVVWDLAELVGRLPGDSLSQQTVAFADSVLTAELGTIEAEALARSEEAARIRLSQSDASPATQLELQIRLNRLDGQIAQRISDYVETLERMEARGIDRPTIVDRLDRFLLGRAEMAIAEMDLAAEDAETLERAIATAGDASEAEMRLRLEVARSRFTDATAALRALIEVMDRRGMDTGDLNEELLVRSRDFTPESVDVQVLGLLARRFSARVTAWISDSGSTAVIRGLSIVAILLVFRLLAGLTRNLTRRAVATSRLNLSRLLQDTFVSWVGRVVMILGILIALSQLGLDLGPVLAGLGVAGFIVGFALQDTLSNFASGMMILIYRPFDVDDLVEAGGEFGTVSALSLVSTTLLTIDNQRLVVPNSQIWGGVIRNVTAQRVRRVDLVFGIGYSDDIPKAEEVLKRIVAQHPKVLDDPEPVVKVHNLGDSSVDFVVRPWCNTDDYWDVHWDITKSVKMTFDAEGISIPFPQRDVHIHEATAD